MRIIRERTAIIEIIPLSGGPQHTIPSVYWETNLPDKPHLDSSHEHGQLTLDRECSAMRSIYEIDKKVR